jgi:hypothetical protein
MLLKIFTNVMAGPVPATHARLTSPNDRGGAAAISIGRQCAWVAGTRPAMTIHEK